ncbi:hypothetical protein CRENBAI_011295, partial [Crenichthys baileyi]
GFEDKPPPLPDPGLKKEGVQVDLPPSTLAEPHRGFYWLPYRSPELHREFSSPITAFQGLVEGSTAGDCGLKVGSRGLATEKQNRKGNEVHDDALAPGLLQGLNIIRLKGLLGSEHAVWGLELDCSTSNLNF